jgi:hypothetical protein
VLSISIPSSETFTICVRCCRTSRSTDLLYLWSIALVRES